MAATPSETFRELSQRFKSLADDSKADNEAGARYVQRASEAAAKALKQFDVLGGEIHWPQPSDVLDAAESVKWALMWHGICLGLKKDYPDRIASDVGAIRITGRGAGIGKASDWRERARDYSTVCEVIAEKIDPQRPLVDGIDNAVSFRRRPAWNRDHKWLHWREREGLGPAKIRDKWNALGDGERKQIAPRQWRKIATNRSGTEVVKQGIKKAKKEATESGK